MGPIEFARACHEERNALLAAFTDPSGQTQVAINLAEAMLTPNQRQQVVAAMEAALTDTIYTLLLALDGSASLGGKQQTFAVYHGDGTVIANGDGRLEAAAWEVFQST